MNNIRRSISEVVKYCPTTNLLVRVDHDGALLTSLIDADTFGTVVLWRFGSNKVFINRNSRIQKLTEVIHCWVRDADIA